MCADPHRVTSHRHAFFPQIHALPRGFRGLSRRQGIGVELADAAGRKDTVAQRSIEMLIGRLITDERFRTDFLSAPEDTLNDLCALGFDLSRAEIAALLNTDPALWIRAASQIDPRLQKVNLSVNESR